jgi:hypothetical protein
VGEVPRLRVLWASETSQITSVASKAAAIAAGKSTFACGPSPARSPAISVAAEPCGVRECADREPDESRVGRRARRQSRSDDRARRQVGRQRSKGQDRERDRLEREQTSACEVESPERQEDGERCGDLRDDTRNAE